MLRKDAGYIGGEMLEIELPGKRKRERIERRFMDLLRGGREGGGYVRQLCERGWWKEQHEMGTDDLVWRPPAVTATRGRRGGRHGKFRNRIGLPI